MTRSLALAVTAALVLTGRSAAQSGDDRVSRVTSGLRRMVQVQGSPVLTWTLADRMAHYHVPGVSIAVAEGGRIVWARGFGRKEAGRGDSVGPTTLFQAASISKPVTATATMRLVQDGKLDLDRPVNTYLKSWQLPDNELTAREKVTLRRILSHSAGLGVHGFPGYEVGKPLPTVPQILDGQKPANTAAVRVEMLPGSTWSYSGGGTTIGQLVLTDVTGAPFPALMKSMVLGPSGMTESTYEQPLPAGRQGQAATGHDRNGAPLPGKWHVYPEMAPAGLWTTPTDLLKWAIEIAAARGGTSTKVLSEATARAMLTLEKGPTGLGPFVEGSGKAFRFGHGGDNAGFHADLLYFPETGQGVAIMTNGDRGRDLLAEIRNSVAVEYGWPGAQPRVLKAVAVDPGDLTRLAGVYLVEYERQKIPTTVSVAGGKLTAKSPFTDLEDELMPESPTSFVGTSGYEYRFDPTGSVVTLVVTVAPGMVLKGERKGGH